MQQTAGAIERFWRVVLVSALDEELDRTDARYGIDVFWKAFLSNRRGYRVGIPTVPLATCMTGCKAEIERRGGEVTLRAPLRADSCRGRCDERAWSSMAGARKAADAYVFALPHEALARFVARGEYRTKHCWRNLSNIHVSPITGVHFWFDREVMSEPFVDAAGYDDAVDLQQNSTLWHGKWRTQWSRAVPATGHQRLL